MVLDSLPDCEGAGMDCVAMTEQELVELAIEAMDGWAFWREDDQNVVELTGPVKPGLLCDG